MHDAQHAFVVLDHRATAFDPVAGIAVRDLVDVTQLGLVDMATHDRIHFTTSRLACHQLFKIGDEAHRSLDLVFEKDGQRPVRVAEAPAWQIEVAIEHNRVCRGSYVHGPNGLKQRKVGEEPLQGNHRPHHDRQQQAHKHRRGGYVFGPSRESMRLFTDAVDNGLDA